MPTAYQLRGGAGHLILAVLSDSLARSGSCSERPSRPHIAHRPALDLSQRGTGRLKSLQPTALVVWRRWAESEGPKSRATITITADWSPSEGRRCRVGSSFDLCHRARSGRNRAPRRTR